MIFFTAIFAYLGPETMLPMTSVVAGVAGVAMLFGRNSLRWAMRAGRRLASMVGRRPKPRAGGRKIGNGPVGRIEATERERTQA